MLLGSLLQCYLLMYNMVFVFLANFSLKYNWVNSSNGFKKESVKYRESIFAVNDLVPVLNLNQLTNSS